MTDQALARRAAACSGWRWVPGMLDTDGWRIGDVTLHDGAREAVRRGVLRLYHYPRLPDLTDHATLGCLLALVREAWGMPTGITVAYSDDTGRWVVSWSGATHGGVCGEGITEGEALVMALENAP